MKIVKNKGITNSSSVIINIKKIISWKSCSLFSILKYPLPQGYVLSLRLYGYKTACGSKRVLPQNEHNGVGDHPSVRKSTILEDRQDGW